MGRGEKNTNCTNHTNICFRRQVLKQVKMQTTSAPMAGCFCKKMCCPNGSRKSHFVQKINGSKRYRDRRIFIFCESNFLSPLRRQFSGLRDGLLKPNVSNPFSPSCQSFYIEVSIAIWQTKYGYKSKVKMAAAQASIAVPPAGKCAGPIPAENRTSCGK